MTSRVRRLIQAVVRFDRSQLRIWTATRCAVGVAAPLLLATAAGKPALGVLGALGALYAGLASFNGVYMHRVRLMVASTAMSSSMTLLGGYLSPYPGLAVGVVGAVAFFFALFAASGAAANLIAVQGVAVLIVISGLRSTSAMPAANAGLVLAGGAFQTILLTAVWPVIGSQPERRAIAGAFASLAEFVRGNSDVSPSEAADGSQAPAAIPDRAVFQQAWDILTQTERHSRPEEHARLHDLLLTAEALRAGVVGFARAYGRTRPTAEETRAAEDLAKGLDTVAEALRRNIPLTTLPALGPTVPDPTRAGIHGADDELAGWIELVDRFLERVRSSVPPARIERAPKMPLAEEVRQGVFNLLGSVELRSLSAKHAFRYGGAVAAAVALSHGWQAGHSYWLPLTVALTLRADYGATLERGVARVFGTITGVIVAEGILAVFHPATPVLVGMMICAAWIGCTVFAANYMYFAVAITVYVISSVSAASPHSHHTGMERSAATVAGAALAVLTNFLVPIWQSKQISAVLREALQAQIAYGESVLAMPGAGTGEEARRTQLEARAMHIEAERVVSAVEHEPRWSRPPDLPDALDVLTCLDESAARLLALHAEAIGDSWGTVRLSMKTRSAAQAAQSRSRSLLKTLA